MRRPTRATRAWSRGHVLAALALGTALGACFNPPAADVMFSCTPGAGAVCPDGYACAADGCCHREGSDVEADFGGCGLGKAASAGPATATTGSSTDAPDTTDAPTTGTADTTGSTGSTPSTSSTTSTSSSTDEPDTSMTDGGTDSGSSSAGTTE